MRCLALLGAVGLLAACGPSSSGVCGAATCTGCCRGNECVTVQDVTACGRGGATCLGCVSGQSCIGGQCATAGGCSSGRVSCGGSCVDTSSDLAHCGSCGRACGSSEKCEQGSCLPLSDCRTAGCTGKTYCDLATGRCEPGCASEAQCAQNEVCKVATHQCEACAGGTHRCGNQCASDTSVDSCGSSCTPCPTQANATATCLNGACGLRCNTGYRLCGGSCVVDTGRCPPPDGGVGVVDCGGTWCGGGDKCCVVIGDGGYALQCLAACSGTSVDCDGPEDCSTGGAPVCCAQFSLGAGGFPFCPLDSASAGCGASCAFSFPSSCPGSGQARACQGNADCASEPSAMYCCLYESGNVSLSICVPQLYKGGAKSCAP
ncbi:MAG: hypothetical protein HYZ28_24675 [Myxococcales bacterium]|nr:hypothetical protein [Myxococcales bacterium]